MGAVVSRRIHICHVFSSFDPGGGEVRAATLINLLGEQFEHTIIAADGRYGTADRLAPSALVRIMQPPPGKGSVFYGLKLLPVLRSIAPDLVTTYNWGAIDAVIASRLARQWPVIHSEDGFGVDELTSLKRRRVLTRRLFLHGAYATVVPSMTLLDIALKQYRLPRERVVFIPNGVDLSAFHPGKLLDWRRSAGIPDHAVVIGTVSALRPEKNFSLLLNAFADLQTPDAYLLFVGDGPCRGELEAVAERREVRPRTLFVGTIRAPADYYRAMDVFALSSVTEQMPIALLEAMACGLPVIATGVGDVPAVLDTSRALQVVPPGDSGSYGEALGRMVADEHLRATLGARNRRRAEEEYPLSKMVQRYERLYSGAASQHRSRWTPLELI